MTGKLDRLDRVARLIREGGSGEVPAAKHRAEKERFLSALDRAAAEEQSPRLAWGIAAGALLGIAVIAVALLRPAPALTYAIEGAPRAEGGYVRAPGGRATVRFSEGTEIAIEPGGRARIAEVGARGARVVLESGRAELRVTHLPGAAWSVEAGPFVIAVTGTAFDVAWSSESERLDLHLRSGSVEVKGPPAPAGVALGAGQHLVADARGKLIIEVEPPAPEAPPATGSADVAPPASAASATGSAIAPPAASARGPGWAARVARGDFRAVLAEAEERGIDAAIAGATLADLAALADAGRYAGRPDVARRAFEAVRARFPGSSEARSASFFLGMLADDRGGSAAAAIAHYDQYLAEAPGGAFAAEALGRKMMAVKRTSGRDAARAVAEEYLRRFPGGAHASVAEDRARSP
jgi:TolA-binding protein